MSATKPHYSYWAEAAKEIKEVMKENGQDKMDVNTERSLEARINIEKVLKKSTGQMQQMLQKMDDDGARVCFNAERGPDLPGLVLALDDVETYESLTNSLAELNQLAKDVQAVYDSFNTADSQRKKRKAEKVRQEPSKKDKTEE